MLIAGLLLILVGCGLLRWCSVGIGLVNPDTRLPGKLPSVEHPAGYMPVGMVGVVLVILGSVLTRGSADYLAWLIATGGMTTALVIPLLIHNHRLPR